MNETTETQRTLLAVYPTLRKWADGFFVARRAEALATTTLNWYREKLEPFFIFCEARNVTTIEAIDAGLIREYLLHLEAAGHNPGGVHGHYRAVKAFLRWYEVEDAPDGWRNPIRKVKAPKVPEEILNPVSIEDVSRLVATCDGSKDGLRDKAILLTLLDTGARATELRSFDLDDLDPVSGALTIKRGKGGKGRTVFLGQKSRRVVRAYLKARGGKPGPLFVTRSHERLKYGGLRGILQRRSRMAGLEAVPSLHSFRRAFGLAMMRAGVDLLTLQRLLGHADLSVLRRYVKQNTDDLQVAHAQASPVDRLGL